MDGVELVSSAILGIEIEPVFIGGKVYQLSPPTVRRFVGAARFLKDIKGDTLKDIVFGMDMEGACKALSWLIQGDEHLYDTFLDSSLDEVQEGLIKGLSLIDPRNFMMLSALQKSVRSLIAKPRS